MCLFGLGALAGLAGAGGAAGGFGTALQALGIVASVAGTVSAANAQNDVAQHNAKIAENNATAERNKASYEAGLIKDRVRRTVGAQIAAQASNGLNVQEGTPVTVLGDTYQQGELDVLSRLYGGEAAGRAYENDATRFRAEGKAAQQAGMIGAGTSLLTGFGKLGAR